MKLLKVISLVFLILIFLMLLTTGLLKDYLKSEFYRKSIALINLKTEKIGLRVTGYERDGLFVSPYLLVFKNIFVAGIGEKSVFSRGILKEVRVFTTWNGGKRFEVFGVHIEGGFFQGSLKKVFDFFKKVKFSSAVKNSKKTVFDSGIRQSFDIVASNIILNLKPLVVKVKSCIIYDGRVLCSLVFFYKNKYASLLLKYEAGSVSVALKEIYPDILSFKRANISLSQGVVEVLNFSFAYGKNSLQCEKLEIKKVFDVTPFFECRNGSVSINGKNYDFSNFKIKFFKNQKKVLFSIRNTSILIKKTAFLKDVSTLKKKGGMKSSLLSLAGGTVKRFEVEIINSTIKFENYDDFLLKNVNLLYSGGRYLLDGNLYSGEKKEGRVSGVFSFKNGVINYDFSYNGCAILTPLVEYLSKNGIKIKDDCTDFLKMSGTIKPFEEINTSGMLSIKVHEMEASTISEDSLKNISLKAKFSVSFDAQNGDIRFILNDVVFQRIGFDLDLELKDIYNPPVVTLKMNFPKQACSDVLISIPHPMREHLDGIYVTGTINFKIFYHADYKKIFRKYDYLFHKTKKPYYYVSKLLISGKNRCKIKKLSNSIDVSKLNDDSFVHTYKIETKDEGIVEIKVGPGSDSYVSIDSLPEYVPIAAILTEDRKFFEHKGVNPELVKSAMELDFYTKKFTYGGSTITQQLVKNLFLYRKKVIARKIEEVIIAWYLEQKVSKKRILELYLNCIEYAPLVYGIENASWYYFGKSAVFLNPLETAFLMACKPSPKECERVRKRKNLPKYWKNRLIQILKRMWKMGKVITKEEFEKYSKEVLIFNLSK